MTELASPDFEITGLQCLGYECDAEMCDFEDLVLLFLVWVVD